MWCHQIILVVFLNNMTKIKKGKKETYEEPRTVKWDRGNARRVTSHQSNMSQQKGRNEIRRKVRAATVARSFLGKSLRTKLKQKTTLTLLFRHQLHCLLTSLYKTFIRQPFLIAYLDREILEESAEKSAGGSAVIPALSVVGKILCSTSYLSLIKELPGGQGK